MRRSSLWRRLRSRFSSFFSSLASQAFRAAVTLSAKLGERERICVVDLLVERVEREERLDFFSESGREGWLAVGGREDSGVIGVIGEVRLEEDWCCVDGALREWL